MSRVPPRLPAYTGAQFRWRAIYFATVGIFTLASGMYYGNVRLEAFSGFAFAGLPVLLALKVWGPPAPVRVVRDQRVPADAAWSVFLRLVGLCESGKPEEFARLTQELDESADGELVKDVQFLSLELGSRLIRREAGQRPSPTWRAQCRKNLSGSRDVLALFGVSEQDAVAFVAACLEDDNIAAESGSRYAGPVVLSVLVANATLEAVRWKSAGQRRRPISA